MALPGSTRLACLAALLLTAPGVAWSQTGAAVTEVTLRSRAVTTMGAGRFSLSLSFGPGFGGAAVSADAVTLGLAGVVSVGSLRAAVALTRGLALQLGGVGALWLAPASSVAGSAQTFDLEGVAGFGLVGGGLAFGAPGEGLRASLLGGVAWMQAPISGQAWTRAGAGLGAGGAVELGHHWSIGGAWTLGLGAMGWFIAGTDGAKWIGDATPTWRSGGGGLFATVSAR